jgi:anti-anti-sigma factor
MISSHIVTELRDSCLLVKILANMDLALAPELQEVFPSLVQHADRKIQLDLSQSHHMDSSGIGAIAFLYKRLQELDFDLELIGLNDQALTLIQSLQINAIIPCASGIKQSPIINAKNAAYPRK